MNSSISAILFIISFVLAACILSWAEGPGFTNGKKDIQGWKPLLAKKGDILVAFITALLLTNSVISS